jgi:hypothetical protein
MVKQSLKEDIIIRCIKILDIGYITSIYFVLALFVGISIDKLLGPFDPIKNDKKNTWCIAAELILQIWIFGILIYIARNVVEIIPSPFNGIYGFEHNRLKELHQAFVFSIILIWNSHYFINKMAFLYKRITK